METAGHSVELNKSGGDSGDAAFTLVKLLNRLDGVHHLVFHREQLAFETVFAHGEDSLFHFVEQIVYLVLFLVSAANALRRGAVNILRRTCWRNGDNFFATSRRRTSASAISRFTRLLSCPGGRLSRHLFVFFFRFCLSSEKWTAFSLRLCGWGLLRRFRLFRRRLHVKLKLGTEIVMQFNLHLVVAGIFYWPFKHDFVPVNLDSNLVLEPVNDVLFGN